MPSLIDIPIAGCEYTQLPSCSIESSCQIKSKFGYFRFCLIGQYLGGDIKYLFTFPSILILDNKTIQGQSYKKKLNYFYFLFCCFYIYNY